MNFANYSLSLVMVGHITPSLIDKRGLTDLSGAGFRDTFYSAEYGLGLAN